MAIAGAALNWLRDNLGVIDNLDDIRDMINDSGKVADVVFVPAFSGLYAPYWRKDARRYEKYSCALSRFACGEMDLEP